MGFRYRPSIRLPYERQGLIYFVSRNYEGQSQRIREKIEQSCKAAAGENWRALFRYVTTDVGMVNVCQEFHVSESTLFRAVQKYYRRMNDHV